MGGRGGGGTPLALSAILFITITVLHCDKLHFCYFSCRWDFLVASVQVLTFLEQVSKNVFMRTVQHYQIVFHLGLVIRACPPTNRGHWPFMCGTEPKKCSAVFYHVDTSVILQVFAWHRCSVFLTHARPGGCGFCFGSHLLRSPAFIPLNRNYLLEVELTGQSPGNWQQQSTL